MLVATTHNGADVLGTDLGVDTLPPTVWDHLLCVAANDLDRETALILQRLGAAGDEIKLRSVTWRQLLIAVHARATELTKLTGSPSRQIGDAPFVVGLLGHSGYQYFLTWLALFMLRWTPLLISIQNSTEAVAHLLKATNASCLLLDNALEERYHNLPTDSARRVLFSSSTASAMSTPQESPGQIEELLHNVELLYGGWNAEELRQEADRTCMFVHTSGSTGHPKPITWTHSFMVGLFKQARGDYMGGRGRVMYTPLPIYHAAGITMTLPVMAGYGGVAALVDPYQAISADSVMQHLRALGPRHPDIFINPSLLEDIVEALGLSEALEFLRIPNTILCGGAPLRPDVGNKLAYGGARLLTYGGTTEIGIFASPVFEPTRDPADWQYLRISSGYEFNFTPFDDKHPEQGYQLVLSPKVVVPAVINNENPRGFLTSDLWLPHPSRPDLWKIGGRLDDTVVLSNGEKVNGQQLDGLLNASPDISCPVIFGNGRFLCGVLLRPPAEYPSVVDDDAAKNTYLEKVWSYIEDRVNPVVPRHSRILQPLILLESPSKPFQLTDKRTVKKKATLDLYREEIEQAYQTVEQGQLGSNNIIAPVFSDITSVTAFIRTLVSTSLGRNIGDDDDFFNSGLDSLLAMKLRFSITSALKADDKSQVHIPRNVVYAHSTTSSLALYLWSVTAVTENREDGALVEDEGRDMVEDVVAKLTAVFPERPPLLVCPGAQDDGDVYIVTGSTGSLGSTFVSTLLQQSVDVVKKVYLLNRPSGKATVMQRHRESFVERGLDFGILEKSADSGRAVMVEMGVSKEKLGISPDTYTEMSTEATHIVHLAWPVTFTYHFRSFIPQLQGLRALIDLALLSPHALPPRLTFISSIIVGNGRLASADSTGIPESPITSVDSALPLGYALSKLAAEKILEKASSVTSLHVSVVRTGQIAGSVVTGAWNRSEYVPSVLRASVRAGVVPNNLFDQYWLPLEHASEALYALTQASIIPQLAFYGLENATSISWGSIVAALLRTHPSLRLISAPEWFQHIRMLQDNQENRDDPLIDGALLEYIEDFCYKCPLPKLATTRLEGISPKVAQLVRFDYNANEGVVESYIRYAARD
ncbi:hypothetical protein BDY19DRAFT_994946 [Irpex rosettiformis]|uniref:Uncharacterized protein n=1 Tax=Irpex rosettiformis TaxID=378272 RepID=A0ACB8U032_9APHY|nr:hypothetical protein BDY19DRAFT_994946 [Irpex rosettiformis]